MTAEESQEKVEESQEKIPVSRREFLNYAWLVSLGFFTIRLLGQPIFLRCRVLKKENSVELSQSEQLKISLV